MTLDKQHKFIQSEDEIKKEKKRLKIFTFFLAIVLFIWSFFCIFNVTNILTLMVLSIQQKVSSSIPYLKIIQDNLYWTIVVSVTLSILVVLIFCLKDKIKEKRMKKKIIKVS